MLDSAKGRSQMRKIVSILVCVVVLGGCAYAEDLGVTKYNTTANEVYLPDIDDPVTVVGCKENVSRCYGRADNECPAGYVIHQQGPVAGSSGRYPHYQVYVTCRETD
jgi:hypothetical protein